jgi:hypothetical protein
MRFNHVVYCITYTVCYLVFCAYNQFVLFPVGAVARLMHLAVRVWSAATVGSKILILAGLAACSLAAVHLARAQQHRGRRDLRVVGDPVADPVGEVESVGDVAAVGDVDLAADVCGNAVVEDTPDVGGEGGAAANTTEDLLIDTFDDDDKDDATAAAEPLSDVREEVVNSDCDDTSEAMQVLPAVVAEDKPTTETGVSPLRAADHGCTAYSSSSGVDRRVARVIARLCGVAAASCRQRGRVANGATAKAAEEKDHQVCIPIQMLAIMDPMQNHGFARDMQILQMLGDR